PSLLVSRLIQGPFQLAEDPAEDPDLAFFQDRPPEEAPDGGENPSRVVLVEKTDPMQHGFEVPVEVFTAPARGQRRLLLPYRACDRAAEYLVGNQKDRLSQIEGREIGVRRDRDEDIAPVDGVPGQSILLGPKQDGDFRTLGAGQNLPDEFGWGDEGTAILAAAAGRSDHQSGVADGGEQLR